MYWWDQVGLYVGSQEHRILCHGPGWDEQPRLELPVLATKYIFPLKHHPIGTTCLHTAVIEICVFLLWMETRPLAAVNYMGIICNCRAKQECFVQEKKKQNQRKIIKGRVSAGKIAVWEGRETEFKELLVH